MKYEVQMMVLMLTKLLLKTKINKKQVMTRKKIVMLTLSHVTRMTSHRVHLTSILAFAKTVISSITKITVIERMAVVAIFSVGKTLMTITHLAIKQIMYLFQVIGQSTPYLRSKYNVTVYYLRMQITTSLMLPSVIHPYYRK